MSQTNDSELKGLPSTTCENVLYLIKKYQEKSKSGHNLFIKEKTFTSVQ